MRDGDGSISRSVTVPLPIGEAFALFTESLRTWWPPEYTWSGDVLENIAMEPWSGGRCFERGPHGFECDWGRVLEWRPRRRVVFSWQISPSRQPVPDPRECSEIEVVFKEEGERSTRVELEHRDFENHGEGAAEYRAAMASDHGWPFILERYARAAE